MSMESMTARPVAPEDIEPGVYVCVMHVVKEYLPDAFFFESNWQEPKPVRLQCLPEETGTPLRVIEVCVPFVLAEQVDGLHRIIDLRCCKLASVSERFGRRAFKRLRPRKPKEAVETPGR